MSDERKAFVFGLMAFGALLIARQVFGPEGVTNFFKVVVGLFIAVIVTGFAAYQFYGILRDLNKGEELGGWSLPFAFLTAVGVSFGMLILQELVAGNEGLLRAPGRAAITLAGILFVVQVAVGLLSWAIAADSYGKDK